MNFLGHLVLSPAEPAVALGNMLGDFFKGRVDCLEVNLPVQAGIRLHRSIDGFTDKHPAFLRSRRRFSPERRRVAGILVDMAYDHVISCAWDDLATVDWQGFMNRADRLLRGAGDFLPESVAVDAERIANHGLLFSYGDSELLGKALSRIARRFSRDVGLAGAEVEITEHYSALRDDLAEFLPEAAAFAEATANDLGYGFTASVRRSD